LINSPEQREESEYVKPLKPNGLIPGGQEDEVQMRSLFIPDSVVVAGYYSEMVLAGTKPGIKSFATSARVLPVCIYSFQPVPKALYWERSARTFWKRRLNKALRLSKPGTTPVESESRLELANIMHSLRTPQANHLEGGSINARFAVVKLRRRTITGI
jgi:hypothetical protein